MKQRKFQVFISSTYKYLKAERQAAVMAILNCGHIPAGMELFAAQDLEQMSVIRRWIDNSDIFLLILGREYGSIDATTNKSYVQLEYEYAIQTNKPYFVLVMDDSILNFEDSEDFQDELKRKLFYEFRNQVLFTVVEFWKDSKDIQLAIFHSMIVFEQRNIAGWVRSSNINYEIIAEQLAESNKKIAELEDKLIIQQRNREDFNGLPYEQFLVNLSQSIQPDIQRFNIKINELNKMSPIREHLKEEEYSLLHYLWAFRDMLARGAKVPHINEFIVGKLAKYDLIETISKTGYEQYRLSSLGKKLITYMELKYPNII